MILFLKAEAQLFALSFSNILCAITNKHHLLCFLFFLSSFIVTQLRLPCIYFANIPETFLHFPTFFPYTVSSLELMPCRSVC